jgi:hypothetical protein
VTAENEEFGTPESMQPATLDASEISEQAETSDKITLAKLHAKFLSSRPQH